MSFPATVHLDSLLPPNPLPSPFRAAWNNMLQRQSKFQPVVWGSLLIYQGSYLLVSLPGFIYQFIPVMKKYKIQSDKHETWEAQWKCVKIALIRIPAFLLPAFISGYFYSEDLSIPYDRDSMPPWYSVTAQCLGCFIIEDPRIYFTHRLMHHKTYPYLHKFHHEFKTPSAMHSLYINLGEYSITRAGIFVAIYVCCKHVFVVWVWFTTLLLKTMDTRSFILTSHALSSGRWGYDIPRIPLRYIAFTVDTAFHDLHHSNFHRNYSPVFTW